LTIHPTTCRCGGTHLGCDSVEELGSAAVRVAAERAAFGGEAGRRRVIRALDAGVVAAAMDQAFPILRAQDAMAQAVAQPAAAPEKRTSTSASSPSPAPRPSSMAAPMGFYARNGLNVEVVRTAGWAVIRDKSFNGEYDAAHMLSPMPLAIPMGAGSNPIPWSVAAIENVNGQAIKLANKHKDGRLRTTFSVILPAAAPTIMTGARISIGIAWLVIVAAEMLVGGTGIGYFVWNQWNNLAIADIVVAILVIGLVGMALDLALGRAARAIAWRE